jgi:NitT/TauT family transport system substrate-binding protein
LAAVRKLQGEGKKIAVAYVFDKSLGIKMFADKAFYAVNAADPKKPAIVPFLLKKDAEAYVAKTGGKLASYNEALAAATMGM